MAEIVSELLAEALWSSGVRTVFGQSLPTSLLLAAERKGIRQVLYRTENAGGAMADGYARMSRRVGVVTAQNGPAATLLVPPLAEAYKASVPLLALVQEVPASMRNRNAFQEIDHLRLYSACTKWMTRVDSPERIEEDFALALTHATGGRPGPVVMMLPKDVLGAETQRTGREFQHAGEVPLDRVAADGESIRRAAELLACARRPIIVAGGGVHLSGACEVLAEVGELAGIAIGTTTMGKGAISEDNELALGVIASYMGRNSLTSGSRAFLQEADVILFVGTRTNENGTDNWRLYPSTAKYIHCDASYEEIGRNYPTLRLTGDARETLSRLLTHLKQMDLRTRQDARAQAVAEIGAGRQRDRKNAARMLDSDDVPIRPERIMRELDSVIDADTVVVADASYSTNWVGAYLTSRRPGQRFLSPRGLAGLGWGLPMALGAQVARPDARVVCIAGDGGFAHSWQELETAVREELPVTVVLLNNGILGFQKHGELQEFGAHTTGVAFGPVNHAQVAEACGVVARRVSAPSELRDSLIWAREHGGPALVEVLVAPDAHPPFTAWDDWVVPA